MKSTPVMAVFIMVAAHGTETNDEAWTEFKAKYGKVYNGDEEQHRYEIFSNNFVFIETENTKGYTYKLGVGPFADLELQEFARTFTGYQKPENIGVPLIGTHEWDSEELPSEVDWVRAGAVSPVKDQGSCGSCWAFSTTGSLESAFQIARGQLVSLSEQQQVDCDHAINRGCSGGSMDGALRWSQSHDLCTEESYPYEAQNKTCRSKGCTVAIPKGAVSGVKDVALIPLLIPASEKNMQSAVAQQPVSVAVAAGNDQFQHYSSGVLTGQCGSRTPPKPDHGVLVVGYGNDPDAGDYWKIKNSWGEGYGESGFLRIQRGGAGRYGLCGVLMNPVYPVVSNSEVIV